MKFFSNFVNLKKKSFFVFQVIELELLFDCSTIDLSRGLLLYVRLWSILIFFKMKILVEFKTNVRQLQVDQIEQSFSLESFSKIK
jgi:hypothetical protein